MNTRPETNRASACFLPLSKLAPALSRRKMVLTRISA